MILCIIHPTVMFPAEPWRIARESTGECDDNLEKGPMSLFIERGVLTSAFYDNPNTYMVPPDNAEDCLVVNTSLPGQLGELLKDNLLTVDSLVVNGPIDKSDFDVMWSASFHGSLKAINLENACIVDGCIPEKAFWHQKEQLEPGGQYINCISLQRLILPENVREIGANAFSYAINLEYINMPSSLRVIGEAAFSDCIRLKVDPLVFPEGMETISDFLFLNCKDLKGEIVLPSTIREIGDGAFFQSKISSINFPEGLNRIGDAAFYACRLKEVRLPESCLNLDGSSTFQLNPELETIRLPEGIECIPSSFADTCLKLHDINIPSSVKNIKNYAFWQCRSLKRLELPHGLESIEANGLWYLDSLEQISFPSTLKHIGAESCAYWANVKRIYCAATEPPLCEDSKINPGKTPFGSYGSTFYMRTPQDTPVYVPVGTSDKYRNAWGWSYFTNFIETDDFPESSVNEVMTEEGLDGQSIFDLTGRKIECPGKGRIYIRNGKKFIYKNK